MQVLTQRDGLLPGLVVALGASESGGAWIGTSGGLTGWDGTTLATHAPGNGLPDGPVTVILETPDALWAGTWGGGLGRCRDGRWTRWTGADSDLPGDFIAGLAATGQDLWIATYGAGLARLDAAGRWSVEGRAQGLPDEWLTALLAVPDGSLWVGMQDAGLARRAPSGAWAALEGPEGARLEVTALAWSGETLWVGTEGGLWSYAPDTQHWSQPEPELATFRINALCLLPDGGLAIGTDEGLWFRETEGPQRLPWADGALRYPVSAVTVDGRGRLWAGSYGRGVMVLGALPRPEVKRLPVLLVHGWRGPDSDRLEDSEFWYLARWLREDGFLAQYVAGIDPAQTLDENAHVLAEAIEQACVDHGVDQVYVVAFSMGGLNTRALLESTHYRGNVARAFILGTPHRGEALWTMLLAWEGIAWSDEPSAAELLPQHAELLNRVQGAHTVPYVLVAGDAHQHSLPTLFRELPAGDGLVSAWSALGVPQGPVDAFESQDIHAYSDDTILLGLPSLLYPRGTYDAFIRPYLFGASTPVDQADAALEWAFTPPMAPPRTGLRTGTLQPGESLDLVPWPLLGGGRARVLLRWKGAAPKVTLVDPQGRAWDSERLPQEDEPEALRLGFADVATYVLTDTLAGDWVLRLDSPDNAETSQYVAYADEVSETRLTVITDRQWYTAGAPLQVTARVSFEPDPGAVISAMLYRFGGLSTAGRNIGLGATEPGAWATTLQAPGAPGYYAILVQVNGNWHGQAFERGEMVVFAVRSQGATLTGAVSSEQLTAADGAHPLRVGVAVQEPGAYLLSVEFEDALGESFGPVAHPVELTADDREVQVPLAGLLSANRQPEWPLKVTAVTLLDRRGAALLADRWSPTSAGNWARQEDYP